jgi:trk system potassium uptake protein TrkH
MNTELTSKSKVTYLIKWILLVPVIMAASSLLVSLIVYDVPGIATFSVSMAIYFLLWIILFFTNKVQPTRTMFTIGEFMLATVLGFLLLFFLCAIPYLTAPYFYFEEGLRISSIVRLEGFENALFESVAGLTTTAFSMIRSEVANLPEGLQWWRSLTQWVGGVGFVTFVHALIRIGGAKYDPEARRKTEEEELEEDDPVIKNTFIWYYLGLTVLCMLGIRAYGIGWWESLNHAMTTVVTGGFTITNDSLSGYGDEFGLILTLMPFMIIGAVDFHIISGLFKRFKRFRWLQNRQFLVLVILIFAGSTLLNALNNYTWIPMSQSENTFHWIAALTTTGFQTTNLELWDSSTIILLVLAMFFGGSTNSTAGGIKIRRLLNYIKGLYFYSKFSIHATNQREGKQQRAERGFLLSASFIGLYLLTLTVVFFCLNLSVSHAFSLKKTLFEAVSAVGNVGLTTGVTTHSLPLLGKIGLMIGMFFGRLELIPLYLLIHQNVSSRIVRSAN